MYEKITPVSLVHLTKYSGYSQFKIGDRSVFHSEASKIKLSMFLSVTRKRDHIASPNTFLIPVVLYADIS